jgi:hypothetical protein
MEIKRRKKKACEQETATERDIYPRHDDQSSKKQKKGGNLKWWIAEREGRIMEKNEEAK